MKRLLGNTFSLLNADHVKLNSRWNYKNIISPYYRLYLVDDGEGYISTPSETLKLEVGYIFIIPSFTLCNLNCPAYLSKYYVQLFEDSKDGLSLFQNNRKLLKLAATEMDVANFKRLLDINPGRGINRSDNPIIYEKSIYYKEYEELNNRQSLAVFIETQGIMLQLLSRFLKSNAFLQKDAAAIPSKVMDAMSYIQLNLKDNITVARLAERANQNQDYFSRIFLQATGIRPITYLHEKRIERAQYLITTTNMPLAEVALHTGFENLPYFSNIFKKITSHTPGEYRNKNRLVGF